MDEFPKQDTSAQTLHSNKFNFIKMKNFCGSTDTNLEKTLLCHIYNQEKIKIQERLIPKH